MDGYSAADFRAGREAANAARNSGWPDALLNLAVALAMAESRANQKPYGDLGRVGEKAADGSTWGPSVGMTHVRTIDEQRGTGGPRDIDRIMDPLENFRATNELMAGRNFTHNGRTWYEPGGMQQWSTLRSGAHVQHLPFANEVLSRLNSGRDYRGNRIGG